MYFNIVSILEKMIHFYTECCWLRGPKLNDSCPESPACWGNSVCCNISIKITTKKIFSKTWTRKKTNFLKFVNTCIFLRSCLVKIQGAPNKRLEVFREDADETKKSNKCNDGFNVIRLTTILREISHKHLS